MRITMVGSGYVGLVSGACFAQFGHDVVCVDKDPSKIEKLKQGVMPIYEPGLDKLVLDNMKAGRLSFSTNLPDSVSGADAVFIAVGTPTRRGDGHADLSYVYAAAAEIAVPDRQELCNRISRLEDRLTEIQRRNINDKINYLTQLKASIEPGLLLDRMSHYMQYMDDIVRRQTLSVQRILEVKRSLFMAHAGKLDADKHIISVCDFSLPSTASRLWIIDLDKKKVLFNTYVAH